MSNPPYRAAGDGHPPADAGKAISTVEAAGGLAEWVDFCGRMGRPKGSVTFIHRADRPDELLVCLRATPGGPVVSPLWSPGHRARGLGGGGGGVRTGPRPG